MLQIQSNLSNPLPEVNPPSEVSSSVPLLDIFSQSSASVGDPPFRKSFNPWVPKQKRCFQRLKSFFILVISLGCQLLRVDFTTAPGGSAGDLREHFQELVRRVKRVYGYDVISFVVETREGNGVLHTVWAIKNRGAVWVPHSWLSEQWAIIHGAPIASIKRMGAGKKDGKRVASYFANQYLSGQSGFVRFSYSWRKLGVTLGRSWDIFKREARRYSEISTWLGLNPSVVTIEREEMFLLWEELLRAGECMVGESLLVLAKGVPVVI